MAEQDREPIGFLFGYINTIEDSKKEGVISFVCVNPKFRNKGIAEQLYERFTQQVWQKGGKQLKAITCKGNIPSLNFHKKMGFRLQFEKTS